ncbi:hypothetical protein T459_12763 [Capsicum annuum]|uniref:Uncharacterized protein n=1 Tax=Capsicum annuum TaxID=4072 RepID=A0A2G2ZQQ9_CAPAN|nr:hypothetical protein T459_12763 [Capsicum annuum]
MQSNSTSIDAPEILNAINITSVQESTYVDSNAEVADMVKSHFDSELPVLGVGDKIPQYVFPDVLSSDSIDATELKFSPLFLKFHSPSAPIGSLPPVLSINDCKWVDTGRLNTPKLFDKLAERSRWLSMLHDSEYIGEAEVLIECSDNLISFCNSYKLLGISLENSFLYFLDRAAISRVERYAINQFRHVRANCKRDISMERYIFENANVFSGNFRSYIYLLSDNMARATTLSLLIELCSSEQVEPGLPLRLPFDFRYKIGNFTRQINLELVISQPARILEWIDSLKGWTSLSPRQEQVEGISMLVGQIEGLSDYDYDSCVGAYIMACFVDGKILKATVLHNEMVVQEIKSNIVLCTNQIHEFCNEYMPLEAGFVLVAGSTWLEVQPFSYSSTAFLIFIRLCNLLLCFTMCLCGISCLEPGLSETAFLLHQRLGREQIGGLVMEEVGTDAFVNFDKMTKSSAQVFLLSETVMFDIHKSNGPLSVVVKKCILMFFEISENRTEHNNLYEAISKNIQFGILLATNSLALSYVVLEHSIMDLVAKLAVGLTHVFGLSMSLSYLTVDVVSHILIFAYTTILVIFIKTKYSFQNITVMQEYVKDPSKFTTITLAPVPATFCDPYGTQTWRKPLETTDAEEKEKQYSMISSKDVLTHHPRCHVSQYKFHFCKAEIFVENYSRSWNHFSSFMCTCNWWHIKLSYLEKTWMQLLWLLNDAFPWISSKLVLKVPIRWGASWITEILHVLMPPIQTALEESDPTINSDLNSKLHQVFNVCPLVLPSKELFGDYLVRCGCIL